MFSLDFTFLWTLFNLIVLYIFLKKVLFGRLGEFLKKRSDSIAAAISQGEEMRSEGKAFKKQCEEQITAAVAESREMLEDARRRAQSEYDNIVAEARNESAVILANGRAEIERERAEMIHALEDRIASLAILAASKVVETNLDNESNKKLVEKFINDEGVA